MDKNYYITTPIYYPSANPHMGHAYSSIVADFFARFKRIDGYKVHFLTGTDEHGLKIQRAAENKKIDPLKFCDEISQTFRDLSKTLNLTNTDFIRTTEQRHIKSVQNLWDKLKQNDEIYLSKYSGWYSVSDEAFYNEDELEEIAGKKIAISSGSTVEWVDEESFFFRLSKWEKPLLKFYEDNPDFICPESKRNEVISFVKNGLKDLSISRKSFSWGIKVPNNDDHVIYVWLDALTNYLSALNYPDTDDELFKNFWPASLHLIGKDILRFHAVYWPAFLLAAKIELPKKVYGHGWILSGEEKMSKSKGNIHFYIEFIVNSLFDANKYFNDQEPWNQKNNKIRLNTIVYTTLEIVRKLSFLLYPIIPDSSLKALNIFGIKESQIKFSTISENEYLKQGQKINMIDILFKKIEKKND
jgi:methionyl-tRNA synthetase